MSAHDLTTHQTIGKLDTCTIWCPAHPNHWQTQREDSMKDAMTDPENPNSGHGHVFPRPDGALARCGGPALCGQCQGDQRLKDQGVGQVTPVSGLSLQGRVCPRCISDTCPGRDTDGEACTSSSVEDFVSLPVIAVPRDFPGSSAEAVALAVAGALTALERERDRAQAVAMALEGQLHRALSTLRVVLDAFPQTSWAKDSHTEGQAREVLAMLDGFPED